MDIPWQEIWNDIEYFLLYIPRRLFEWFMEGVAWLINSIPVPDFVADIPSLFSGLPTGIPWAFYLFNVGLGISIILTAYVARFFIRRLPIVG